MEPHILLAIVDDQELVRQGIISLILKLGPYKVVIEAEEGNDLFRQLEKTTTLPDICLLDLSSPHGMDGFQSLPILRKKYPTIAVIVLTFFAEEDVKSKVLSLGAAHFLSKNIGFEILRAVLEDVYDSFRKNNYTVPKRNAKKYFPSEQEMKVLKLSAKGYTAHEVGDKLYISDRTVEVHIRHLLNKLELPNKVALVSYAFHCGWIS